MHGKKVKDLVVFSLVIRGGGEIRLRQHERVLRMGGSSWDTLY